MGSKQPVMRLKPFLIDVYARIIMRTAIALDKLTYELGMWVNVNYYGYTHKQLLHEVLSLLKEQHYLNYGIKKDLS